MGGGNMNQMIKQAQKMQRQMEEKQAELESMVFAALASRSIASTERAAPSQRP